ncbi:MAG: hypothetical protein HY432_00435 [Candidatus Liptonbacteria bacterium]|nr:hypothetical protein [Candidatus Liptonbacteria bacterium]
MGLVDDLLTILSGYSGGYRLMRRKISGNVWQSSGKSFNAFQASSDAVVRVTLSRLKKKGFVENKRGLWQITKAGRTYLTNKIPLFPEHSKKVSKSMPKNIVVSFDIPEKFRHKRNWLRLELSYLGFEMLQKSLWLGPAPLPEEFADSLRKLQLLPHVKFFEAKETDIV